MLTGNPAGCNTSAVCHALDARDLLGRGRLLDGSYTDRDRDLARLLLCIVNHPEGILRTRLVHLVLKGTAPYDGGLGWRDVDGNHLEAERGDQDDRTALQRHTDSLDRIASRNTSLQLDGSDSDYQFARRKTDLLEAAGFVRLEDSPAGTRVSPTIDAVTLISEGITETHDGDDGTVYDREFARTVLKNLRGPRKALSDSQKDLLANSLARYIRRTNDYRLLFDVTLNGWRGSSTERMVKSYKTRFTDAGRRDKSFARLQQALEWGYEHADSAVFATLTTDPKEFDSLYDAIMAINRNFHRLTQYMSSDPSTKKDTRSNSVHNWTPHLHDSVTGRPRESLQYVKVLEYTEKGYPHLHVLFFDPPRREKDGCPWLIDTNELKHVWRQGDIVDLYPLTYRDDLDEVGYFGDEVVHDEDGEVVYVDSHGVESHADDPGATPKTRPISEGFVCWYQHGDHGHSQEWADRRSRYHRDNGQIDMLGDDDNMQQKTAGSYIGKYMSKMYETLQTATESDFDPDDAEGAAWWKLALYWVTNRRFWTCSNGIRDAIRLGDPEPDLEPEVAAAVKRCSVDTVRRLVEDDVDDIEDLPDLDPRKQRSRMCELLSGPLVNIDYLGAFHFADLPPQNLMLKNLDGAMQVAYQDGRISLASRGDRPPPTAAVWG